MCLYTTTDGFELTTKRPIDEVQKGKVTRFGAVIKVRLISCSSRKNFNELVTMLTKSTFDCIPIVVDTLRVKDHGVKRYWILVESQGISLNKLLMKHPDKFYFKGLISEFYQNILKALLVVTKNLMETPFRGVMKSDAILIWIPVHGDFPRVILTNFITRDSDADDWENLGKLIERVNKKINFHVHCKQPDMTELTNVLRDPIKDKLAELKYYPVFWKRSERRSFLISISVDQDCTSSSKLYSPDIAKKVLGDPVIDWFTTIQNSDLDPDIVKLFAKSLGQTTGIHAKRHRWHFLNALRFFRNVYAHSSESLSKSCLVGIFVDDLQALLENLFPLLVWEMYLKVKNDEALIPKAHLVNFY